MLNERRLKGGFCSIPAPRCREHPLIALLTIVIEHGSIAKINHLRQVPFLYLAGLPLDTTPHFPTPYFSAKDQR